MMFRLSGVQALSCTLLAWEVQQRIDEHNVLKNFVLGRFDAEDLQCFKSCR